MDDFADFADRNRLLYTLQGILRDVKRLVNGMPCKGVSECGTMQDKVKTSRVFGLEMHLRAQF